MQKNYLKENDAPKEIRDRNRQLEEAFEMLQETIFRIQGWLEEESMRYFAISDFKDHPHVVSTISQVFTRFCMVSLGADEMGRFSIILSIDQNINEKIGRDFSSLLLRRLFEFTSGECEPFVFIDSYSSDCDQGLFQTVVEIEKGAKWHSFIIVNLNSLEE